MPGRPTKLTKARHDAIVKSVKIGAYRDTAAEAAGISSRSFRSWMERGEADDEHGRDTVFRRFFRAVKRAEAKAEVAAVGVVQAAAEAGNWQAAMTFLERKRPQEWGRRLHVRDDTPRMPAPLRQPSVAQFEAAFAASFGDELPDVDAANMMPSIGIDDDTSSGNGRRNGAG